MEHFAHVVEQIDDKIAAIKLDIKETVLVAEADGVGW